MKYFAMIDGVRQGPYELDELAEAGVRPDTYVWCKGMETWEKAEDVADICRMYRQRISSLMHPTVYQPTEIMSDQTPARQEQEAEEEPAGPTRYGTFQDAPFPEEENPAMMPRPILLAAIFVTVFCFPPTGFAAIFYSIKSRKLWYASRVEQGEQARQLQTEAHSANRMARMLTGISFFLGLIVWAFLGRYL